MCAMDNTKRCANFNVLIAKLKAIAGNLATPTDLDLTPPDAVANAAKQGLAWHSQFNRGGTMVGVTRAHELANKTPMTLATIKQMRNFFSRHRKNKARNLPNGEPANGQIAWALWGGDPGQMWVEEILKRQQL